SRPEADSPSGSQSFFALGNHFIGLLAGARSVMSRITLNAPASRLLPETAGLRLDLTRQRSRSDQCGHTSLSWAGMPTILFTFRARRAGCGRSRRAGLC